MELFCFILFSIPFLLFVCSNQKISTDTAFANAIFLDSILGLPCKTEHRTILNLFQEEMNIFATANAIQHISLSLGAIFL